MPENSAQFFSCFKDLMLSLEERGWDEVRNVGVDVRNTILSTQFNQYPPPV